MTTRSGRYGPAQPIIRLCSVCGLQLPAGKVFHVQPTDESGVSCAEVHREQLRQEGKIK